MANPFFIVFWTKKEKFKNTVFTLYRGGERFGKE
jgi:hypothetical protein